MAYVAYGQTSKLAQYRDLWKKGQIENKKSTKVMSKI